ncbi:segregation and condensation protein A [Persicobacter psychrovividus]|uniref:Segregation and condensation protein A n=1 Tax=Persicobacter psychrovividus TaxID=387638 RepID=A0ABM7VEL8_9BACT|nr:segregation and condensation protein A [Persicobacter psychrovividus]
MSFEIKLPLFEGPFDLLLFFIQRDELDVHDIPIAKITADFLSYLDAMNKLDVELASDFMVVAATLMRIKSKMLLPRPELDEQGEEIDPREELMQHLLAYKKYKSVMEDFRKMEERELGKQKRGNIIAEQQELASEYATEMEMHNLDMYKLLKVYQQVMRRKEAQEEEHVHQITPYDYTISGQKEWLLSLLKAEGKQNFEELFMAVGNRIGMIFTFLAILELAQWQELSLTIGAGFNSFWVEPI